MIKNWRDYIVNVPFGTLTLRVTSHGHVTVAGVPQADGTTVAAPLAVADKIYPYLLVADRSSGGYVSIERRGKYPSKGWTRPACYGNAELKILRFFAEKALQQA